MLLTVICALFSTSAFAQFTYTEDFKNSTAAGWVLNPAGNSTPAPVLTSGAAPRVGDPEIANSVIDPSGAGWLRLTNNTTNEHNAVYFDTPIPSAGNSVNVTFGVNMYGGNNLLGTGADGLTFFLYDASKTFTVGASGGSIGYAQKDAGTLGTIDAANDHNGLNGAWVGVTLDAYGNYSVAGEGRIGGTASLQPNSVVVRGPGDGLTGYNYLAGTGNRDYTDTGSATVLDATDGTVPSLPYTMAYATATARPNQSTQYRNVSITFDENSQLTVSMQFGEDGLWYNVLSVDLSSFVRPEQLKMGFAAGTGDGTQIYEIGGLLSVTASAGTGNFVWDNGEGAAFKVWGTGANDPLNWAGNTNPTLKANVLFNSTFVTTAQAIDVTGSDKVIKNMYFGGANAYTLSTSDQRKLIFDSDSTGVPTSINITSDVSGNTSHTIAMDVQMNKNLEINNNITPVFTISGGIDTNGNTLTMKGVGTTLLSGAITGTGALVKNDTGTTILNGADANTYSGTTTVNGGTLQIEKATALGSTAAGTTVNAGGTLALGGTGTTFAAEALALNGDGVGASGALRNVAGNNTWTGTVALGTAGSNSIGVDTGTNLTVSGVVSGAAGNNLTKTGTGTLTLAGTNTFSGTTTINAGTVAVSSDANLGTAPGAATAGQLTLNGGTLENTATMTLNANRGIALGAGGGTISTDAATTLTYNGIAAGTGALTKAGAGTLLLGGVNTYTGATNINAGTLQLGTPNALSSSTAVTVASGATFNLANNSNTVASLAGAGNVTLGSGTLTLSGTNSTTFAGVASGTGGLTKTGSSTLTLSGANTFTGSLTLGNGTANAANVVGLGASNVLANNAGLVLNGGTFATNGFSDTLGGLSLLAVSTIDFGSQAGTLSFSGTNVYTAGSLSIANWAGNTTGGGASQLLVNSLTALSGTFLNNISFTGYATGAQIIQVGAFYELVPVTGSSYTWGVNNDGNWTSTSWAGGVSNPGGIGTTSVFGSAITANHTVTVNTAGTTVGYLVFNDDNNYTIAGTNRLTMDVTGGSAAITTSNTGATTISAGLTLNDALIINQNSTGTLTLSNANAITGTNQNITVNGAGNTAITGTITTGSGTLTKNNAGTLTLAGANTYTGATTINGGTVKISADNNLGTAPGAATAGQLTLNGGTLENTATMTLSATRGVALGANGGTFNTDAGTVLTYNGIAAGTGALTKAGTGTLLLGGVNTYTGATNITAGTLQLGATGTLSNSTAVTVASGATFNLNSFSDTIGSLAGAGTVTLGTATLTAGGDGTSTTFSGAINGSGGLTKAGAGTLTLTGNNGYTGATSVGAGGALNLQSSTALGTAAGGVTVANTAALELQGGINIGAEAISLTGTGVSSNGALRNISGNNIATGTVTLAGATTIQSDSGTLALGGAINATNQNLTLSGAGNITASGSIGLGTGTLTKSGTGYVTLSGTNVYTGATSITGGTLEIQNGTALGSAAGGTTVGDNATLALSGSITAAETPLAITGKGVGLAGAIRSLSGTNTLAGNITLSGESSVGVDADTLTASGVVSGSAGITKVGAGTLVLSNANTYTGTTAITAGTLEVRNAGALGSTAGTTTTTIASGATLALSNNVALPGTLGGTTENITVQGAGVGNNGAILSVSGNNSIAGALNMTGASTIGVTAGTLTASGTISGAYDLVKAGDGNLVISGAANTYSGTTTVRGGSLTVTANAPATGNGSLGSSNSLVQLGDTGSTGTVSLLAGGAGGVTVDRQVSVNNFGTGTTIGGTNTAGTNTFSGNITLGKDASLTAAAGGTVNVSGVIDGTGGLTKTGAGTVVLSSANTYAGATNVTLGTLQVTNAGALGSTAAGTTVSGTGAALGLSGGIALAAGEALTLNGTGVSGTGALVNLSGNNTVAGPISLASATTIGSTANTLTLSGAISGTSTLATTGAGNIALTGSNTFTGATTIGGTGTVTLNATGGALAATTGLTLNSGSLLSLGASNQVNDAANLTLSGGTLLLNGYQEVLQNVTLNAATTSHVDYLNDGSLLRFTGTATIGASGTLTIDNWAGNPVSGSGSYGLLFNTQAQALALENSVLFNGWSTLGANTVVANGAYWEIVPTVTVREWLSTAGGNWDTNASWTGSTQPDAVGSIALLGNAITAGTTVNINTSAGGLDNEIVGKLIIDATGGRSYNVNGSDRLDFSNGGAATQLIVAGDGTHSITTTGGVRVVDSLTITNDDTAATGLTISSAMDLRNGTTSNLTVSGTGATLISGVISNNTTGASLLKTGAGTLTLNGNNTFSGGTTLRNGTLVLNNANATGSAATIVVNDAGTTAAMDTSLLLGTTGLTLSKAVTVGGQGDVTTLGGASNLVLGTDAVTFSGAIALGKNVALTAAGSSTATFSGVLSGVGGLDKIGSGTVVLGGTAANTNSGDVSVSAGTLEITKSVANGAIGDAADVTIAGGATLKFNNGQAETIGSLAGAGTLNNASATAMTLTTGGNNASTTFSGSITDSGGNLTLVKTGTGTMTLSGTNSFDGQTNINAGTLIAASNTALGATTNKTTVAQDATLGLQGNITVTGEQLDLAAKTAANIASVSNFSDNNTFTGAISLTGTTAGDDVKFDAATGSQLTLSGVISNATNAKDVFKTGGGTLVLSGANTYGGQTSVAAGTLVVSNNAALGAAAAGTADDTFVQIGATLAFDHATGVTLGSGEDITLYTTATPTAASLKNISGTNTISGNVTMSGGVNTGVIIDANAGTLNLAGVVTNGANANSITKTGAGTLTLSGTSANTFGGAFTVNDGTVVLAKTAGVNAVGPGDLNIGDSIGGTASAVVQLNASNQINNATAVTIATDGKLDLQANSDTIAALTMSGGAVTATGAGTLTLGGNLTFNGIGANTASITANVDLGGNRIVQVGNNGVTGDTDLALNGVVSGTGSSFTKTDLGTLSLTGAANTFTGNFQITDGTVVLDKTAVAGVKGNATGVGNASVTIGDNVRGANTAIMQVSGNGLAAGQTSDQIANTATLTVNSDGRFVMARTTGTVTDSFTETVGALAGTGNVDLGYYALVAGGNNANTTFAGTLVGQSTSLLEKAGTGTLTIDSNLGFGGTVNLTGGTLAFDVNNAFTTVNIAAGTTLRLSDATLNIANLNLTGTGTITLDFAGGASMLNVTNLNVGAGITLNIVNWQNAVDFFYAANWTGAVVDVRGVTPENQVVFNSPTYTGNDTKWQGYDHQITPVPEPSTYGALLLGAMGALLGCHRWRKAKTATQA